MPSTTKDDGYSVSGGGSADARSTGDPLHIEDFFKVDLEIRLFLVSYLLYPPLQDDRVAPCCGKRRNTKSITWSVLVKYFWRDTDYFVFNQMGPAASPSNTHGHGSSHGKTVLSVCCPCGTNNNSTKTEPIERLQQLLSQPCGTQEETLLHCGHDDKCAFQTEEALQREVLCLPAPQIC